MGTQIIYLEEPVRVTFKSSNLSALTTFQLLLQKEQLDYLVVAGHYIVGNRERLYDDFYNRMILTHYNTKYISVQTLQNLIRQLNIPVENITVDVNTQEIWVQGTPMALGKFVELLNEVDRRENAAFNTGGDRIIRMPVSFSQGINAYNELEALRDLLDTLLVGHLNVKTESYAGQLQSGVIKIIIKRVEDSDLYYLIVEGTPDDIEIVRKMIAEIRSSMGTLPFSFNPDAEDNGNENGSGNGNGNGNSNGNGNGEEN